METDKRIESATAAELAARPSLSDWVAAAAMDHAEIDRQADEEDGPLPEGWERTIALGIPKPPR